MISFNNAEHAAQIAAAARVPIGPADVSISYSVDGVLRGGVIYHNFTGASIEMHQAAFSKHWITRDMLWVCFHYPFAKLGVKKVFGLTPSSNPKVIELNKKLGFTIETVVGEVFPDGDLVVMSMKRDDCRWLKIEPRAFEWSVKSSNGKKQSSAAA
ncbi:MAG TPA: GNAT family protein [Xanthobacteraceae bacterium]|nr:GNAT family protein [Xanthobacteraceae bacterium]